MQLDVGEILEGKVSGITDFGAFVTLSGGMSGLVHISEISNSYVNNVRDHLSVGDTVKVKIVRIDDNGKINLSIKKAQEPVPPPRRREPVTQQSVNHAPKDNFEDKLKRFIADADSKLSGNRLYENRRGSGRRRK